VVVLCLSLSYGASMLYRWFFSLPEKCAQLLSLRWVDVPGSLRSPYFFG